ncbi:Gfo/Idh/MocA family oxidoreductase [Candidatus Bathyarchaeota archaeon]|nr:Gfo/Idh/MocA family oxidoreductase [Candidatus Bathyarchaeota archaeon]
MKIEVVLGKLIPTDNRIRAGIAGLGRSGWNIHANILEKLSDKYEIVAVSDPIEERRKEAATRFGCRTYSDFEGLTKDREVELIIVATPSYLHASHTILALKSGKNVVCEKPMAANLSEANAMIEASKETGNILTVFHNSLFAPDYLKVKEVIRSGKLGRIVLIKIYKHVFSRRWDWQTLRKFGGGELRNNAVHSIVQGLQILGDKEPEVFCDLQRTLTLGDAEDHVKILLKAPNSPLIDIEVTRACAYPQNKWLVMGTQGGLTGTFNSLKWKYFDSEALPPRMLKIEPTPDRSYNFDKYIPWREETWSLSEDYSSGGVIFYRELYNALRYKAPPPVPPNLAYRVMQIVEKCYEKCAMIFQ